MAHPRLIGLFLLLVALGLFLTLDLDESIPILRLCGFLFCFVSGWLVLIFFWNDGDIERLRRKNKEMSQRRAVPGMPVLEKTYRYPALKGARRAVMLCLCVFYLGIAIAGFFLLISAEEGADVATVEFLYFVFGLFLSFGVFLCWYTWRYSRLFIKVDSKGITASTYLGMRNVDWEDIIALRDWIPFRGSGSISDLLSADFALYKIYTNNHMISFPSGLLDADQLVRLISKASGLDWT